MRTDRLLAISSGPDQLGQQRVEYGGTTAPVKQCVSTRSPRRSGTENSDSVPGDGSFAGDVLGVEPAFDGMSGERHVLLLKAQLLAGGDSQLQRHQVEAGDGFGDRMLDLDPAVDLEKVRVAPGCVDDELGRAEVDVADRGGERDRRLAQDRARGLGQCRRGASSITF